MPKFFVLPENVHEDVIRITGEDVLHIKRVLRMKAGDKIHLCDSSGFDYDAVIDQMTDSGIECRVTAKRESDTEPPIKVMLFQGIPKGTKTDYIIQKNTELGISDIVMCRLARCVSKPEGSKKTERWQKIAESAAKQSGRGLVPKVHEPVDLDTAISMMKKCDLAFVPYECEENCSIKSVLKNSSDAKSIAFMIGPEGGFGIGEIEKLKNAGITPVSLGKRILRTETAGEAVLTMIMYELGDI